MHLDRPYIIGVSGRSGSGKTTFVNNVRSSFSKLDVTVHTMDNYYKAREEQEKDEKGYLNFDLPTSFYRDKFHKDLHQLISGKDVILPKYEFNNDKEFVDIVIPASRIIVVEGLFIYYYSEISSLLDFKVFVSLSFETSFLRRLNRDIHERNYCEEEIRHRYLNHVEPSFDQYINPFMNEMDLIVDNSNNLKEGEGIIREVIKSKLIKV